MHVSSPVQTEEPVEQRWIPDVRLLVPTTPWRAIFFANLRDLLDPPELPPLALRSAPAPFWPDVFVKCELPWRRFLESAGYHVVAFVLLVSFSRLLALGPHAALPPTFDHSPVVYYQAAEYLPPLDTRRNNATAPQEADPELSRQRIISVPPEADKRFQTLVSPPRVKLNHDEQLPNIVAWSGRPELPIAPAPLIPASSVTRLAPQLETPVVAPPPDLRTSAQTAFQAPQPAVIEPPPNVASPSRRALGELNIGHTAVIAPAPQLAVGEQRAFSVVAAGAGMASLVVPPPPALGGSSTSAAGGRVIALNLHPAVGAPPVAPPGNRRGTFAATPAGHAGASGNPGGSSTVAAGANGSGKGSSKDGGGGGRTGRRGSSAVPAGLYVGSAADPSKTGPVAGDPAPKNAAPHSVNPKLMASLPPSRVSNVPGRSLQPESETKLSEAERTVFGTRKFYLLTLNMPNLNSSGGSWVIRFAELKQNGGASDLAAPAATRKIDPAYPLELMRQNVAGTVILYAVIHADGTVGNVRVLSSVDERLDHYASQAISRWRFQPATRNGSSVDVEATFHIPFRPGRPNF